MSYQYLAAELRESTVIESVTVTALTADLSYVVLLSNTTEVQPSVIMWKSCEHIKRGVWGQLKLSHIFLITLYVPGPFLYLFVLTSVSSIKPMISGKLNNITILAFVSCLVTCLFGTHFIIISKTTSFCITVTVIGDGEDRSCEGVSLFAHKFN